MQKSKFDRVLEEVARREHMSVQEVREEMQAAMSEFLTIMNDVAPASIGGSIPGDDFYCVFNG